jgi:ubiquinone biosynthesis protein UbiJ
MNPFSILENVLNHYVQESTAAMDLVESLDGKSLAIDIDGVGASFELRSVGGGIILSADVCEDPTARLSGTPLTLLGLLRDDSPEGLRASGAALAGDAPTAEAFSEVLRLARPELEEELSRLIGDLAAQRIASLAREAAAWGSRAGSAVRANVSEFLQEESRQLPPRLEVEGFRSDVERLRDDVDRAAYRVDRLLGPSSDADKTTACDESD